MSNLLLFKKGWSYIVEPTEIMAKVQRRSGSDRADLQMLALEYQRTPYQPILNGPHTRGMNDYLERDVQVLKVGDSRDELFRREGSAEILELDSNQSGYGDSGKFNHSSEVMNDSVKFNLEDYDEIQQRSVGIDNEGIMTFEQHRALPLSQGMHSAGAKPITRMKADVESKMVQTDDSYLQRKMSKKVQTIHLDESDSDDDKDLANQSLNQSMTSSLHGPAYDKSFQDPGFLNMAMRTLVGDQLKNGRQGMWNIRESRQGHDRDEFEHDTIRKSFASSLPRRSFSRHSDQDSQTRLSKKRGQIYFNGNRTPPTPNYTETKASILRRRTVNVQPHENSLTKRPSVLSNYHSSSMTDLTRASKRRIDKTNKIHGSTPESLELF
ncbi:hypothetical protein TCAL_13485 [Tigriopus californicus]|uniref:Uncharacterized protein n=1 Tax=Tigriopus californicus TaxID=6832 RepID=A0A553P443_TIGCA|nr:hypothetical protein TCAL_13485 [Tigriopus californicus]